MSNLPILLILLAIALFFLCRELMCWYWKINKHLENQDKIISFLQQLVDKKNDPHVANPPSGSGYESFIGQQVTVTQKNGARIQGEVIASEKPDEFLALFTSGDVMKIRLEFIKDIEIINN